MSTSVNHPNMERDWCVPVGSFAGADDVPDTANAVYAAGVSGVLAELIAFL
jgi:hypothetical protein